MVLKYRWEEHRAGSLTRAIFVDTRVSVPVDHHLVQAESFQVSHVEILYESFEALMTESFVGLEEAATNPYVFIQSIEASTLELVVGPMYIFHF